MHHTLGNQRWTDRDPVSRQGITLVLPAFNEAESIAIAIDEANQALQMLTPNYEIIVVDDGSSDATASIVRSKTSGNSHLRLIQHPQNRGYGAALRSGFNAASMPLVAFTDADCQFHLKELDRLMLLSRDYDIVCGYRIDRKDSFLRCFYSRGYNQLVRLLLGTKVRDIDCALKVFRHSALQNLEITTNGFLVNSELLTQAEQQGLSVVEVGVSHRPRIAGESTVSIGEIPKVLTNLLRLWWNKVQFPSAACADRETSPQRLRKLAAYQFALLLVASCFLFLNLGYPLIDRDETRYAEIPREMLATGNWIIPQLNFEPYYDKPPLVYWLCAISYRLLGVSEWSARLVPALAALATLATTIWFGNRWFGRRVGLYSGLALMLSAGFVYCSRCLLLDGVLTAFVAPSLMAAYEAIRGDKLRPGWWLAAAVLCGLAFLVKGPLAIVLCLPPIAVFAWLTTSTARPRLSHYAMFAGVVVLMVAPWIVLVSLHDSRYLHEFFITHNVRRFMGEMHARPIWYFIPVLLVAAHPWSSLTIPLAQFIIGRGDAVRLRRPPALGFLVICAAWVFVFFSLSKCKLPTYLLPAAPAFALIVGNYLSLILHEGSSCSFRIARFWSPKLATIASSVAAIGFLIFAYSADISLSIAIYAWAILWTAILVGAVLLIRDISKPKAAWKTSTLITAMLGLMVMHHLVPAYSRTRTLFGPGSPLNVDSVSSSTIATMSLEFPGVPFYLDRNDIRHLSGSAPGELTAFLKDHEQAVLIVHDRVMASQLLSGLPPDSSLHFLGRRGDANILRIDHSSRVAHRSSSETQSR